MHSASAREYIDLSWIVKALQLVVAGKIVAVEYTGELPDVHGWS